MARCVCIRESAVHNLILSIPLTSVTRLRVGLTFYD